MALATIIRRSASSVAPLAIRFVQTQRQHQAAIFTALYHTTLSRKTSSSPFYLHALNYSSSPAVKRTSSDDTLIRVIESEIECALETDDHNRVEEIPAGFPFKIEDNPGQQTISLSREYQGEVITVDVHMSDLVSGEDDDDDDDAEQPSGSQPSVPLVVSVTKKSGGPTLEFSCTAFPDEIAIDSLAVKNPDTDEDQIAYEGPDFSELDENLQKAFHKYLEIRGIKPSTTNFLHEYMINKDSREYLMWLKNLKNFIEA